MHKLKFVALGIVALAVISGLLVLPAPTPADYTWFEFHSNFSLGVAMAILFVGASVLFWKGLGGFSDTLKRAYLYICIGIALLGVAQVTLPLSILFDLQKQTWNGPVLALPFLVSILTIFGGIRALSKLFGVKSLSRSWLLAFGIVAVVGSVVVMLPHPTEVAAELDFDVENVFIMLMAVLLGMAATQLIQAKRLASAAYTNALAWFSIGLLTVMSTGILRAGFLLAVGNADWYEKFGNSALVILPFTIAGVFLVRSAYSFSRITVAGNAEPGWMARNFFGKVKQPRQKAGVTSIDIVIYAANLASNPAAIDDKLEQVRELTANFKPGQEPTPEDDSRLMQVYLDLEQYLVSQERIRVFNKDSLRQNVAQALQLTNNENTFWPKLSQTV